MSFNRLANRGNIKRCSLRSVLQFWGILLCSWKFQDQLRAWLCATIFGSIVPTGWRMVLIDLNGLRFLPWNIFPEWLQLLGVLRFPCARVSFISNMSWLLVFVINYIAWTMLSKVKFCICLGSEPFQFAFRRLCEKILELLQCIAVFFCCETTCLAEHPIPRRIVLILDKLRHQNKTITWSW
jgi:hypothetical protein